MLARAREMYRQRRAREERQEEPPREASGAAHAPSLDRAAANAAGAAAESESGSDVAVARASAAGAAAPSDPPLQRRMLALQAAEARRTGQGQP